jgi:hypothetical protein
MSDLLNSASLVLIPSGYKEDTVYSVVPSDGSGDLSFTRASNGTRVNSAGLVEVCPWNLLQQSETFSNGAWVKVNTTVTTDSITAPNGTNTADKIVATNTASSTRSVYTGFTPISGTTYTVSIYVKAAEYTKFVINEIGNGSFGASFDLSAQTSTSLGGAGYVSSAITDIGNGWFMCSVRVLGGSVGYAVSYIGYPTGATLSASGVSYAGNGTSGIYIWGAQLNIGSTAKPYFPTTDRLNVPRLTYQNGGGGCPSLLLEKQSTNLVSYSQAFDDASWTKQNTTVTTNATTSPDGTTNAQKIIPNTTNGTHYVEKFVTISAVDYTYTIYAKKGEYNYLYVNAYSNSSRRTWFNLDNGTVSFNTSPNIASITSVGNGWYRCIITNTSSGATGAFQFGAAIDNGTSNATPSFTGDGTSGIFVWGAQLEASTYPTSYIPTTSASATRVADACFKTGISSLIGQTEGTIFVDFVILGNSGVENRLSISDGTTNNWIFIGTPEDATNGGSRFYIRTNSATHVDVGTAGYFSVGQRYKLALAYKSGDWAIYGNGTLLFNGTTTIDAVSSPLSVLNFFNSSGGSAQVGEQVNETILSKTRLSNSELQSLTTL